MEKYMRFHLCACALVSSISISAFAEPPIHAGDTLESLSKVKISTTINGQAGSLQELIANGQIRIVPSANANLTNPTENMAQQPANQISPNKPIWLKKIRLWRCLSEPNLNRNTQRRLSRWTNNTYQPPSVPLLSSSADLPVNAGDDVDVTAEALNAAPPSPAAPEQQSICPRLNGLKPQHYGTGYRYKRYRFKSCTAKWYGTIRAV